MVALLSLVFDCSKGQRPALPLMVEFVWSPASRYTESVKVKLNSIIELTQSKKGLTSTGTFGGMTFGILLVSAGFTIIHFSINLA